MDASQVRTKRLRMALVVGNEWVRPDAVRFSRRDQQKLCIMMMGKLLMTDRSWSKACRIESR